MIGARAEDSCERLGSSETKINRIASHALVLASAIVLSLQVLALASRHFHDQLNSDDLYPYVFGQDVVHGVWPLSGWTLSSAPYYFPDFSLYSLLLALTGWQGASIPAYAVLSAVGLALLTGWLLRSLDPFAPAPWGRGFLAINGLLLLSQIPGWDRWIWWELTPGFHGGALLLSVAIAALSAREIQGLTSRRQLVILTCLLWLGAWSDSFLIVETIVPLLGVIILLTKDRADFVTPIRRYIFVILAATGLLFLLLAMLHWGEIFFAGKIFRYAPTPTLMGRTARLFWNDLWGERFPVTVTILVMFTGVAVVLIRDVLGKWILPQPHRMAIRFMTYWTVLGSAGLISAMVFMGYWHDESNARYLLPLHVWPLIATATLLPAAMGRLTAFQRGRLAILYAGLLVWIGLNSVGDISKEKLIFPYPNEIAQLDAFLSERHLSRGLADYWTMHRYNVLGRAGVRVSALRSTGNSEFGAGVASFWNSNVYTLLDREERSGRWKKPAYTFIVVNRLDESSLLARYGEPQERAKVGEWQIWILSPTQKIRTADLIEADVHARLHGRRWDRVAGDLK